MMRKVVRISEEDLKGLAKFLNEGTERSMSMSSLQKGPKGIKTRVASNKGMTETDMTNDRIELKVKGKPMNFKNNDELKERELKERMNSLGVDPSLFDKARNKDISAEELMTTLYDQIKANVSNLSPIEKMELDATANFFKQLGKEIDAKLKAKEEAELEEEEDNIEEDASIIRAVTPEGIKTIGKLVNGEIVPCTEEEERLISEMDSHINMQELIEKEYDVDSFAAFNDIMEEYDEEDNYEEEVELLNIYEAAELMVEESFAYSINDAIELYKDKDGKVTMSIQSEDIDIFSELFDVNDIAVLVKDYNIYPIGSEALSEVHKQDPNTKFTFFLNNVDGEIASKFDGDTPRTLSEILTYAYLTSNNNATIYNEVMSNMVLQKA